MALSATLISEDPSERRCEERWRVLLGAQWHETPKTGQTVTILDVSPTGMLVETEEPIETGSSLSLEFPNESTKTLTTVWNSGPFHGAVFDEPLDNAEVQKIICASSVVWPRFGEKSEGSPAKAENSQTTETTDAFCIDEKTKLPGAIRLMIIVGSTTLLWAMISAGVYSALG